MLHELALFAGAGGGILGGRLLGWRTVCAVEFDPYAAGVLVARQNDGCLDPFPIWDDVRTFDGRPWRGRVDVVSGGFPCQDISAAGKGAGIDGERSGMWVEMARIIGEVRPRFAFVENSPVLTSRGLGRVLGDLASLGYHALWGVLGADDAGAPHQRKRIWIVAHTAGVRERSGTRRRRHEGRHEFMESTRARGNTHDSGQEMAHHPQHRRRERRTRRSDSSSERELEQPFQNVADTDESRRAGMSGSVRQTDGMRQSARSRESRRDLPDSDVIDDDERRHGAGALLRKQWESPVIPASKKLPDSDRAGREQQRSPRANAAEQFAPECGRWWRTEPDVGRVAHGVAARVDRLRCLGNGQVPAVAALAWNILTADLDID